MQKKSLFLALSLLILVLLVVGGCGSSNKEGGIANVTKVGDTACVQCHSSTVDQITGESIVTQYNRSAHKDADGCEGCHGNGGQHNGVGPIPYPKPDVTRCEYCHDGKTAPVTTAAKWANSNHAKPYEETTGDPCYRCHTSEGAIVSDNLGYTGDKDNVLLNSNYIPVLVLDRTKFKMEINCETCHEYGGKLRQVKGTNPATGAVVAWDPNKNRLLDEFDLCTSCHLYKTFDGSKFIALGKPFTGFSSLKHYHETAWYRQIASTHYDLPSTGLGSGTGGAQSTKIEGYVIRENSDHPCFDCHNHNFTTNTRAKSNTTSTEILNRPSTIYTDWASSAHAGKLLAQKKTADTGIRSQDVVNAVIQAGVVDDTGAAWAHYDWDNSSGDSNDRKTCQRCHTATGASNFLSDPTNYNPDNNSFTISLVGPIPIRNLHRTSYFIVGDVIKMLKQES